MADELIVLKLDGENATLIPSSPYLQLSDDSLRRISLNSYPCQPIVIQFDNNDIELTNRIDLRTVSSREACNCDRMIILERWNREKIEWHKYKKADAYMKLLHYLYTPIIFPFMRKNLSSIIDRIELEHVCFNDCFAQFDTLKKGIEG